MENQMAALYQGWLLNKVLNKVLHLFSFKNGVLVLCQRAIAVDVLLKPEEISPSNWCPFTSDSLDELLFSLLPQEPPRLVLSGQDLGQRPGSHSAEWAGLASNATEMAHQRLSMWGPHTLNPHSLKCLYNTSDYYSWAELGQLPFLDYNSQKAPATTCDRAG